MTVLNSSPFGGNKRLKRSFICPFKSSSQSSQTSSTRHTDPQRASFDPQSTQDDYLSSFDITSSQLSSSPGKELKSSRPSVNITNSAALGQWTSSKMNSRAEQFAAEKTRTSFSPGHIARNTSESAIYRHKQPASLARALSEASPLATLRKVPETIGSGDGISAAKNVMRNDSLEKVLEHDSKQLNEVQNSSHAKTIEGIYFDEEDFDEFDFPTIVPDSSSDDRYSWSSSPKITNRDQSVIELQNGPKPLAQSPLRNVVTYRTLYHEPNNANSPINKQNFANPGAPSIRKQDAILLDDLEVDGQAKEREKEAENEKQRRLPWDLCYEERKKLFKANSHNAKNVQKTVNKPEVMAPAVPKKKKNKLPQIFLSDEQKGILKIIELEKANIFYTGSAGTGKSVLLREVILALRKRYHPDLIAVTASTGLAACNIGGITLHSFAGIGLGHDTKENLVRKIKKNKKSYTRWKSIKVLIIDEISMLDGDLFDKLEGLARELRKNEKPFGGIQLVLTGDFFQLPPVSQSTSVSKFCFESSTWSTCVKYTIKLSQVFRQSDPEFIKMLNEMREGTLSIDSIKRFKQLDRTPVYKDGLVPTELFPTRAEVDRANASRMALIPGSSKVFEAVDGGQLPDKASKDRLLQNVMAPITLELKENTQVMLIKNIDDQLVNGSLGRVLGFMNDTTFQLWMETNPGPDDSPFEYALDELIEMGGHQSTIEKRKRQRAVEQMLSNPSKHKVWPLIRFVLGDGSTRDMLCQPETWNVEGPNGEIFASRQQVPLILAYAISIHKAQGQTLERVKVDLGRVFEKGQAYVALSRATSRGGLQVLNFDAKKVQAHSKVSQFYRNLQSFDSEETGKFSQMRKHHEHKQNVGNMSENRDIRLRQSSLNDIFTSGSRTSKSAILQAYKTELESQVTDVTVKAHRNRRTVHGQEPEIIDLAN